MGRAEALVEDYLVARVKATGGTIRKLQWIGRDGAPDRLIWWHFPIVALVECKSRRGRYEPSQPRELARLREAGWPVYTVYTKEQVDAFIQDMLAMGAGLV